jgi:hypothetical protein
MVTGPSTNKQLTELRETWQQDLWQSESGYYSSALVSIQL